MPKKPSLGRGLDDLFLEAGENELPEVKNKLRITEIQPKSNQPRKKFDAESLSELAESIAANGVIEPIVVRAVAGGMYEIIAGERRWRASKMAGLTEVPVVILDTDDRQAAEMSLIENIQREDLNPVEEAMAFRALIDAYGLTQEALASRIGKSRSAIANTLRILDLPDSILSLIADGSITEGHVRALQGLRDKSAIEDAAQIVIARKLSVRETEDFVRRCNEKAEEEEVEPQPASVKDVDYIAELEKKIRRTIGRRVRIRDGKRTKKLEIEYTDNDDLEKLLCSLCGEQILDD